MDSWLVLQLQKPLAQGGVEAGSKESSPCICKEVWGGKLFGENAINTKTVPEQTQLMQIL